MTDIEEIKVLATIFRHAIEKTPNLPAPLDQFPKGACGETSDLLAQWLWEHGFKSSYYCGSNDDGNTHAWLEVGDIIVDITGDQFPEFPEPVYVGQISRFHSQFSTPEVVHKMNNGFHVYDSGSVARLNHEYKMILKAM